MAGALGRGGGGNQRGALAVARDTMSVTQAQPAAGAQTVSCRTLCSGGAECTCDRRARTSRPGTADLTRALSPPPDQQLSPVQDCSPRQGLWLRLPPAQHRSLLQRQFAGPATLQVPKKRCAAHAHKAPHRRRDRRGTLESSGRPLMQRCFTHRRFRQSACTSRCRVSESGTEHRCPGQLGLVRPSRVAGPAKQCGCTPRRPCMADCVGRECCGPACPGRGLSRGGSTGLRGAGPNGSKRSTPRPCR